MDYPAPVILPMFDHMLQVVISTLVTAFLGFVAAKINEFVRARTTEHELSVIQDFAARAVLAAEQAGLAGIIQNIGQEKKEFAIHFMEDLLAQSKIKVPVRLIMNYLEAAVFEYLNANKPAPVADADKG